jgi:hypothetical protein
MGSRSLTGCYRRDCVSLVSGCRDAVSVLTDREPETGRESCRIVSVLFARMNGCEIGRG